VTQEIVVHVRIEPEEPHPAGPEVATASVEGSEPIELLILDAETPPLEEAGYGHGV
jgi:hypothetical protein